MPRKKSFLQVAIDNLKEALQEGRKIRQALERTDKRSISRGQKLVKEIGKNYTDKEIATSLGVSRQKYTALKIQIKKGRAGSSVLNDLLEQTKGTIARDTGRPQAMTGEYQTEKRVNGKKKFKVDYVEMGKDYIDKKMPWAQNVKPGGFASRQSALNWYGGVTGGKEYFKLVKGSKTVKGPKGQRVIYTRYFIYDTRTPAERSRKGKVAGSAKAERIIANDIIK